MRSTADLCAWSESALLSSTDREQLLIFDLSQQKMCKYFARAGEQGNTSIILAFLSIAFTLVEWENDPFH